MRGKVEACGLTMLIVGITPAYAGKRIRIFQRSKNPGDHPRVCGEKPAGGIVVRNRGGSPPRMRGKAVHRFPDSVRPGITPAYAGKSLLCLFCLRFGWDHPRVCGEKTASCTVCKVSMGSPPRMRGKALQCFNNVCFAGITPAYAGKSVQTVETVAARWDHPRVCGEKTKKIP